MWQNEGDPKNDSLSTNLENVPQKNKRPRSVSKRQFSTHAVINRRITEFEARAAAAAVLMPRDLGTNRCVFLAASDDSLKLRVLQPDPCSSLYSIEVPGNRDF